MKTKFLPVIIFATISLSLFAGNSNAGEIKTTLIDTSCCPPDSLKVVSKTFPVFCVSWHVASDSNCRVPYGFEIQWRRYVGAGPWSSFIKIYTGGTTENFCTRVDTCTVYQWRVRTICDTLNGGTYSDWVYGNKIIMDCGIVALTDDIREQAEKLNITLQAIKPKEQD